jgi:GT2 family glycosyltransferase
VRATESLARNVTLATPTLVTLRHDWLGFLPDASAIVEDYCSPTTNGPAIAATVYGVLRARDEPNDNVVVSVVVVTHNNSQLIGDCLDAIHNSLKTRDAEIIVVDNASSDGTRDVISRATGPVTVIALERAVGFAEAVNVALRASCRPYVVLVNSDAFLDPGCIDELIDMLEHGSRVGIVGAKLRYPSGRFQPSAGTFPSLLGGLWVALFLHRVPGLSRLGIGYLADERLYRRSRRVDWVSAAVCAARSEVGPLPSSSFMYGEDVEWAAVCRDAGLEVWLQPSATAIHIGRASVDQNRDAGFAQRRRAQFELRWFARRGRVAQLAARFTLLVHAVLRLAVYGGITVLRGHRDPRLTEYVALLRAALSAYPPRM